MRCRVRKFEDLPVNAQRYVEYIEKTLGVPINFIGVGPSREAVILHWIVCCNTQQNVVYLYIYIYSERERAWRESFTTIIGNRLQAAGQKLLACLRGGALHSSRPSIAPRSTSNSRAGRGRARCNAAENRPSRRSLGARSSTWHMQTN